MQSKDQSAKACFIDVVFSNYKNLSNAVSLLLSILGVVVSWGDLEIEGRILVVALALIFVFFIHFTKNAFLLFVDARKELNSCVAAKDDAETVYEEEIKELKSLLVTASLTEFNVIKIRTGHYYSSKPQIVIEKADLSIGQVLALYYYEDNDTKFSVGLLKVTNINHSGVQAEFIWGNSMEDSPLAPSHVGLHENLKVKSVINLIDIDRD